MSDGFERAHLLLDRRKYDLAEQEAGLLLVQDPEDAEAHWLMALAQLHQEKRKEAEHHARQAVGLAPDEAWTHRTLSVVLLDRRDLPGAEKFARRAVAIDPLDEDNFTQLGHVLLQQKEWDEALFAATKALELNPDDVDALNIQAQALQQTGQSGPAISQLKQSLANDPDDAYTHATMGWTYLEQGQRDGAMRHFREALRLDADLEYARIGAIETLKSYNPVYRVLLSFFLWMASKSTSMQWLIVLGLILADIVINRLAANYPALRPVLYPFIFAYLLFLCGTWFGRSIGNFTLLMHPFGRMALLKREKIESVAIVSLVTFAVLGFALHLLLGPKTDAGGLAKAVALFPGFMALPVALCFQEQRPVPLCWLIIMTSMLAILGTIHLTTMSIVHTFDVEYLVKYPLFVLFFVFWIRVGLNVYIWGCALSPLAYNLISVREWLRD